MTAQQLAQAVLSRPAIRRSLDDLTAYSVASQFSALITDSALADLTFDWPHLLRVGSVLAQSRFAECEDSALRIAHSCLTFSDLASHKDAACVLLDVLTNGPSIQLAERRSLVEPDANRRLPFLLRVEWLRREISSLVCVGNDSEISLNRFQVSVWQALNNTQFLSVTAPTSSGKSFLLCQWLKEYFENTPNTLVVYLVPTRALIQQVERDLREEFQPTNGNQEKHLEVNVSSLPMVDSIKANCPNVLVLTQERLHILLIALSSSNTPSLIIVDEAHKVADGSRGVLLTNVIDSVYARSPELKLFFASPMVSNPEILLRGRSSVGTTDSIVSSHITVNQNLMWATQVPRKTKQWTIELCLGGEFRTLGEIQLPFRPNPLSKRLTMVAHVMADPEGGNLVYADGAADAEKAAHQLRELQPDAFPVSDELSGLIDLVRRYIHPRYALANALGKGIAFHYGNMPLLIRTEIERLFREGHIKFLVCTSTLIEGVNLPCKTIFVRGPRKGRGRPMNETDFWRGCPVGC